MQLLQSLLHEHQAATCLFLRRLIALDVPFLLHSQIKEKFDQFCETPAGAPLKFSTIATIINNSIEAVIRPPWVSFRTRIQIGKSNYICFNSEDLKCSQQSVSEFLQFKEKLSENPPQEKAWQLEIDLEPFERGFPRLKESRSIGRGVEFLNRHLAGKLFSEPGKGERYLFDFLRIHRCGGKQLMVTDRIKSVDGLREALREAEEYLATQPPEASWHSVKERLQRLGFEVGWGRTAKRIRDTMALLRDILEAASPRSLEQFLSRIPMIFNVVMVSPHGYFAQEGVLGRPDTGGQVVYILQQVRALAREARRRNKEQGLDIQPQILVVTRLIPEAKGTTCSQRIERIQGTRNAKILRVPFRYETGEVVPHWISRFRIWPFLERFALDAEKEVLSKLRGRPDLIIGNYSDGNLVASLMSRRLGVTQCNIAHALEKTKYLYSAFFWKNYEKNYHFECQFSADLIAMNTADFIITSSYQEIAGTRNSEGQYESYSAFTMPGLYRVRKGIEVLDPKFNIVCPGPDPNLFFPYWKKRRRFKELHPEIERRIYDEKRPTARGSLADRNKPLIFLMARLDRIKNISGFVKLYGRNPKLRKLANVFVASGTIDTSKCQSEEERNESELLHQLMDEYELDTQVRWLGEGLEQNYVAEVFRYVADGRGIFVHPALFEAFGLTIVEAMACGLPSFATRYGGPSEIIEDGISGFHIDPAQPELVSQRMADFLQQCQQDPGRWHTVSGNALQRTKKRYNWKLYAQRLMTLSRVYGFWKYVSNLERAETRSYLGMFYSLMFKKLARNAGD